MMKYILVSGGGISGIGKGIIASSTGLLLKAMGLKVTAIKIDPYLNIGERLCGLIWLGYILINSADAGLMNPLEHGEVFVLDDGGEVDLDLGRLFGRVGQIQMLITISAGNYERYLQISLRKENNITTGKIYQSVIEQERRGDYLGKTVQVVPHITDATQDWCERVAAIPVDDSKETPDVCIIELGGTVGDIESAPFIESMRQLRMRAGSKDNFVGIASRKQGPGADISIATYTCYLYPRNSRRTEDQINPTGDTRCTKRRLVSRSYCLPLRAGA